MLDILKRPSTAEVLQQCAKIREQHATEGALTAAAVTAGKGDPDAILSNLSREEREHTYCERKLARARLRGDKDKVNQAMSEAARNPTIKGKQFALTGAQGTGDSLAGKVSNLALQRTEGDSELLRLAKYSHYFKSRAPEREKIRAAIKALPNSRYSQTKRALNAVKFGGIKLGRWIKDNRVLGGGSTVATIVLLKLALIIFIADEITGGKKSKPNPNAPQAVNVGGPGALLNGNPMQFEGLGPAQF